MADDSDIDSWYSKKQDLLICPGKKTGAIVLSSCNSKFNNSTFSGAPENGILGFSNGYASSIDNYRETKPKSSRSEPEVRFINPAIYAESLTPSNDPQEATSNSQNTTDAEANVIVEVRCGDLSDLPQRFSSLSVNEESPRSGGGDHSDQTAADTYRCSLQSNTSQTSTLTLTNNSKSITRLIRRCAIDGSSKIFANGNEEDVQRFSLNGRNRVVQFSSTSLSSSSAFSDGRTNGLALARKIAHEDWVQKKQRAAQEKTEAEKRAELRHREEEDRIEKERLERERKERENFLRWQERKKKEEANRKLAVEQELDLQRRLKAVEDQAAVVKIIHLQQWARRKEDAQRAQQKEQELKRKAIDEERKNRLEKSSQAFEKWRENAKSRPRPATQGLLPHQRAKPSFVNPKPWQQIVDDDPAEQSLPKKDSSTKKLDCEPENHLRKSVASHQ